MRVGKQVVADPCHRQVGEHFLVVGQALADDAVARGDDDVVVGEHHALGLAGRAGRVEHDRHVATSTEGDLALVKFGIGAIELDTQLLYLLVVVQKVLIIVTQAAGIVVDNLFDLGTALAYLEHLVYLFLVFDQRNLDVGIVEHIGHFVRDRVLVQRHRHRAERLRCGHPPVQARAIVADDGELVAPFQAEAGKSAGERSHLHRDIGPGPGLPDAEIFFTHRVPLRTRLHVVLQQLGEGIECRVLFLRIHEQVFRYYAIAREHIGHRVGGIGCTGPITTLKRGAVKFICGFLPRPAPGDSAIGEVCKAVHRIDARDARTAKQRWRQDCRRYRIGGNLSSEPARPRPWRRL